MSENSIISEGVKISHKKAIAIFVNLNISCLAMSMLCTALTTTLPPIMKDFHINVNKAQWLTSGYELFLSIFTPMTAYLITKFKTKKLYLTSISFFLVGLTICMVSPNFPLMMIGRIIQGCGNGLLTSMAQVIILTIFPKEKSGTMMGIYGISIGVSPVIAPSLAGLLIDHVGWRSIFGISIIVMGFSLIFALIVFEDVLPLVKRDIDFTSIFLCVLAYGGVSLAISNFGTSDIGSIEVVLPFIIGTIGSIFFAWRQLKIEVPFLDIRVLADKTFTLGTILTFILELIMMGSIMICPIYVQEVKEESATISGLVMFPGSLAMAIVSPIAGMIYDKKGIRQLTLVGSFISMVINIMLYFVTYYQSVWITSVLNIVKCLTFGLHFMPLLSWALRDIPKIKSSDANAVYMSFRALGCAVGTSLFVSIMTKVTKMVENYHPHPKMYGINVTYFVMAILAIIMFLIAYWGCDSQSSSYNKYNNEEGGEGEEYKKVEMESQEVIQTSSYIKIDMEGSNDDINDINNDNDTKDTKDTNNSNEES